MNESRHMNVHVDTTRSIREDGGEPIPTPLASKRIIDFLDFAWKAETMGTAVARTSPDHGPRHWRDVARIGLTIGKRSNLTGEELAAVFCFAAIHDTQRQTEYHDPEHGERAAEVMLAIATDQHQVVLGDFRERCRLALRDHDKGELSSDPLIGSCWDADRLTLGRVGIPPSIDFMSTDFVRGNFPRVCFEAECVCIDDDRPWHEIAADYANQI